MNDTQTLQVLKRQFWSLKTRVEQSRVEVVAMRINVLTTLLKLRAQLCGEEMYLRYRTPVRSYLLTGDDDTFSVYKEHAPDVASFYCAAESLSIETLASDAMWDLDYISLCRSSIEALEAKMIIWCTYPNDFLTEIEAFNVALETALSEGLQTE